MSSPSCAYEPKPSLDCTTSLAHPNANISVDANIEARDVAISRTCARFPLPKGMTERRDILDFPQTAIEARWENGKGFQDSRARRFARAKMSIERALGLHLSKNKTTSYGGQVEELMKMSEAQEQERKDQST
jgi:hypothetical protein